MTSGDDQRERLAEFIAPFRVEPGTKVALERDFDPAFKKGVKDKKAGRALLAEGVDRLAEYQARLAAQDTWGVLVLLQAIDAAGKDGTIRHVMSGVNPQGVSVHSFKVPSVEELDHDYLWRYAKRLPARGEIGIFNRSHYEEVLVVRVHAENLERQKLPERPRRAMSGSAATGRSTTGSATSPTTASGSSSSSSTSRRRSSAPGSTPDRPARSQLEVLGGGHRRAGALGPLPARVLRRAVAHEHPWAPWYVIPADRKWYARLGAAAVIEHALMEIDPHFPKVTGSQREQLLRIKEELEAAGAEGRHGRPVRRPRRRRMICRQPPSLHAPSFTPEGRPAGRGDVLEVLAERRRLAARIVALQDRGERRRVRAGAVAHDGRARLGGFDLRLGLFGLRLGLLGVIAGLGGRLLGRGRVLSGLRPLLLSLVEVLLRASRSAFVVPRSCSRSW